MNVFIIDDEYDNILLMKYGLMGHCVDYALTGKEGIQKAIIYSDFIHVIVLDFHLPDLNGIEICKKLQEDNNTKCIPIIICTSDTRVGKLIHTEPINVHKVIYKPINFEIFTKEIENAVSLCI